MSLESILLDSDLNMMRYLDKTIYELTERLHKYEQAEELCSKIKDKPIFKKVKTAGVYTIIEQDYTPTDLICLYDFKDNKIVIIYDTGYAQDFDSVDELYIDEYDETWAFTKEMLQ